MNVRLKDELIERGYAYREMRLDHTYRQFFMPNGKLALTMAKFYDYPFMTRTAKTISKSKALSYEYAALHGAIVPKTLQTNDFEQAVAFLKLHGTLVVKPAGLGAGRDVTIGITTSDELKRAMTAADRHDAPPLLQEQFDGDEIRLTVLDGKVKSAIYRQSPSVVGDGQTSVKDLIANENKARESLVFPLLTYSQLSPELISPAFFEDDRVPAHGERIKLSTASMIRHGASFYGITETVHPSFVTIAEKMANGLNPPLLIVYFMVKDYTLPATQDNSIFLEFNTSPGLEPYSSLRSGDDQRHVIGLFADLVDRYAQAYLQ
jgi:D-alanine-D-alanine ligase-like ATP-grasp enzyme